jgi:hypothetical protein
VERPKAAFLRPKSGTDPDVAVQAEQAAEPTTQSLEDYPERPAVWPPITPVTPDEVKRRTQIIKRMLERRNEMEALDTSTDLMILQDREADPNRYG